MDKLGYYLIKYISVSMCISEMMDLNIAGVINTFVNVDPFYQVVRQMLSDIVIQPQAPLFVQLHNHSSRQQLCDTGNVEGCRHAHY